jgi:succinate dehydrogenase/fumarate reductase flavoprotein subunit
LRVDENKDLRMIDFESAKTDVLIIGACAAGIRASLAAAEEGADVLVVSIGPVTRSGSTFSSLSAAWGIQALLGDERTDQNLEEFFREIVEAGLGVCDERLARILVEESGPRVEELMAYGLRFKKDPNGRHLRVKGCFSEHERAFLTEDAENIRSSFQAMLRRESIPGEESRKRAVKERAKHHPFSSRDRSGLVDLALAEARKSGNRVFYRRSKSEAEQLEVVHMAHAFNGGAAIDEKAETTVPGLFAAGEVAAGPHGADRVGGCMMTATQVFGARAGRFAARFALERTLAETANPLPALLCKSKERGSESISPAALASARETFAKEAMVLRDGRGLEECLQRIGEARTAIAGETEPLTRVTGEHLLTVMEIVTMAALQREESLGPHYRADIPLGANPA